MNLLVENEKETFKRPHRNPSNEKSNERSNSSSDTDSHTSSSTSAVTKDGKTEDKKEKKRDRKEKKKIRKIEKKMKKEKRKIEKAKKKLEKAEREREKNIKNSAKKMKNLNSTEDSDDCGVPIDLMFTRAKAPQTPEEYEAKQKEIRRITDPVTGRIRLIRGDGEILEEIVSRDKHREINAKATRNDGEFFQSKTIGWNEK